VTVSLFPVAMLSVIDSHHLSVSTATLTEEPALMATQLLCINLWTLPLPELAVTPVLINCSIDESKFKSCTIHTVTGCKYKYY